MKARVKNANPSSRLSFKWYKYNQNTKQDEVLRSKRQFLYLYLQPYFNFIYDSGNETHRSQRLVIKNFDRTHIGNYKCQISKAFENGRPSLEVFSQAASIEAIENSECKYFEIITYLYFSENKISKCMAKKYLSNQHSLT